MSDHQPMPSRLETERLVLRPWAEADVESYRALAGERRGEVPDLESGREVVARQIATPARSGIGLLVLEGREEGEFLGYCGLVVGRATLEEPEIAYELFRHAHGRGYATEAARAVVAAAAETGRKRLWATVGPWNTPSFRVLEKLGFHRDREGADERGEFVWLTRDLP